MKSNLKLVTVKSIKFEVIWSPTTVKTDLLRHSPDVGEPFPEDDIDPLGPTPECRGGAVEGRVTSPKHQNYAP